MSGTSDRGNKFRVGEMNIVNIRACVAGAFGLIVLAAPACAGSLAEQFASCAAKFASSKAAASVMLECTAADGKLTDCKVTEATPASGGFDKAALCVADALPVGSRTGSIKVPIKFEPAK